MCTFCSDLPPNQYGANHKKAPITLFLKPNDPNNENEKYRFRILNFRSQAKNDRAYPFISRYVHNHWSKNDNGINVVDECVVCPSTPYIDAKNDATLGYADTYRELKLRDKKPTYDLVCPICRHVQEMWSSWKSSGKTDRLAIERINSLRKQFQGVVPVYVVNDPVNPKNNGRFKCIIFNLKEEYDKFIDVVNAERAKIAASGGKYGWCNGTNAVDFYLRMDKVPVIYNAGKANEKQGVARRITKMAFGSKAYDLVDGNGSEIVTKEAIDRFEFDDQYYIKSTKMELEDFYSKFYGGAPSNIPEEDDDVFSDETSTVAQTKQPAPMKVPTNPTATTAQEVPDEVTNLANDVDEMPMGSDVPDEVPEDVEDETPSQSSTQSVDELLDQLDFND